MNRNRFVFPGLIYCVFAIIISRFPLFNYLGYEFSAAIALIVPLLSGGSTFSILRQSTSDRKELVRAIFESFRINISLLIIPLAVITINALFVKNCSYGEGLLFYVLLPCITVIFSTSLALACFLFVRRARLMYAILTIAILCHPLYIGYTTPSIASYNFIYGYFPGFSYDEVMTISFTLVDFRFTTLIAAAFLLLVSIRTLQCSGSDQGFLKKLIAFITPEQITPLVSGIILSAMLLVVWWIYRDALGFEASSSFIGRTLSAQQQTEHFRIHYAPASFTKEEMQWAAAEHEFRFHQVETALQVKFPGLIDSYIYPDSDTKRRFIGTGTTNIAKPWRKEIHLNKDSWQSTLKHELVHVVAGEFGMPVIHAHYHTGLVEGLATAIDGDWGNRTLHEYAAAMKKFELVRSPAHLITPLGFAMQSSSLSYVMMGSFCKFLLNRYGLIRFKELYGGKSIEVVYGKSYEQLVDEWQHFIERVRVPEDWQEHVEFYFKRPSIFAKECARAIAKMNDDGWRQLAKNNSSSAMQEFSRSLHASWNTEAFSGFVRSAYQAAQYDTVIQLMNKQLQDSLQRNSILNLMLIYGDALWYKGDVLSARKAYKNILTLDLSERYNEAASSRLAAMNDKELGVALPGFFVGTLSDSAAIDLLTDLEKHNGHILLPYIKAKILFRMKNYGEAGQELDGATTSFGISILDESKEQLLGEIFFRQKKFQSARLHFWQSLNYISNEASIQRVDDWLERCEWYEGNKFTTN